MKSEMNVIFADLNLWNKYSDWSKLDYYSSLNNLVKNSLKEITENILKIINICLINTSINTCPGRMTGEWVSTTVFIILDIFY